MTPQLNRLAILLGAGFLAIALATGYWQIVRGDGLLQRADNPRRALTERRVPRGTIYDRNGAVLADVAGEPGAWIRHYPYPNLAPVLGYVSPLVGSAGVEAALDPVLHGDGGLDPLTIYWRTSVLGTPPPGRAVKLSIDLSLQRVTDTALGTHVGAVVLLEAQTGEILALASHPTFDANNIDDHWQDVVNNPGSPLVNRATFALYQPGGAIEPIVVAGALQAGLTRPEKIYVAADQPVTFDGQTIACRVTPPQPALTIGAALASGCPSPFTALGQSLGTAGLTKLFAQFRLFTDPALVIPTTAASADQAGVFPDAGPAGIGQAGLTVTPLHMALVTAALARHGVMPAPQLVLQTQAPDGQWQNTEPVSPTLSVVDTAVADQVKAMLSDGLQATAVTGTAGKALAWFIGFSPLDDPHYAVAVLLEDGDPQAAHDIGVALLEAAR
jgi:peptidoglycan glycosyltransferase